MTRTRGPLRTRPAPAVQMYETGLTSLRLWAQDSVGRRMPLPISDWTSGAVPGDASLLARCYGPALDIGCGPGRLVSALAATDIEALGIDVSAAAIALARATGASAVRRSVFGRVPSPGQWKCALLADGNIGIGGDPGALLRRARELLAPRSTVLVELARPGSATGQLELRLMNDSGGVSEWFPWAQVGVDGIDVLATATGFVVTECWTSAGRWFAQMSTD